MPADITLTGNVQGLSTVGGNVGPASFSYALDDVANYHTQEIPVPLGASGQVVAVPTLGVTHRLFYLKTTEDVDVTLNSEPAGTLFKGGVLIRCGMDNVTTMSFDGNGSVDAVVFLTVVGD